MLRCPGADRGERGLEGLAERGQLVLDALGAAELLAATPLLVMHGKTDACRPPELPRELFERATGEKEIVWLDAGQHNDLYDREPYVTRAVAATAGFLRRML